MSSTSLEHSGSGPINVNQGSGIQRNYVNSGGSNNRQYNAEVIHYQEYGNQQFNANTIFFTPSETRRSPINAIPFPRDSDFVQRIETHELKEKLSKPGSRVALTGLGGIGKSQLAIQYGYDLRESSPQVWTLWIFADNAARFDQGIRELADDVKIVGRQNASGRELFQLVRDWLADARNQWLIVLDGADDVEFLFAAPDVNDGSRRSRISYLPVCDHGSLLITTRSQASALRMVEEENLITLEPDSEHATALLAKKLRLNLNDDESQAAELVQALAFMPLAITQAAAYIKKRAPRCSLSQYLSMFLESDKRKVDLLSSESTDIRRNASVSNSIMLTWQIAFDYILQKQQSLVEEDERHLGPDYPSTVQHKSSLASMLWTHGDREASKQLRQDILDSMTKVLGRDHPDALNCMLKLAECYREQKQWKAAEKQGEELVDIWTRLCGSEHPDTQQCKTNLAKTFKRQAKWAETEGLEKQIVEDRRRVMGHSHVTTLDAMVELASTYGSQARWSEAEHLLKEVVEARLDTLGPNNVITLNNKAALAETHWKRGQWKEAQRLEEEVLNSRKTVLGLDRRDTMESAVKLISAYQEQGLVERVRDSQTDLRGSTLS